MKRFEKYEPQVGEVVEVDRGEKGVVRCRAVLANPLWKHHPCVYCIFSYEYNDNGDFAFPCGAILCGGYELPRSDGKQIVFVENNEEENED